MVHTLGNPNWQAFSVVTPEQVTSRPAKPGSGDRGETWGMGFDSVKDELPWQGVESVAAIELSYDILGRSAGEGNQRLVDVLTPCRFAHSELKFATGAPDFFPEDCAHRTSSKPS